MDDPITQKNDSQSFFIVFRDHLSFPCSGVSRAKGGGSGRGQGPSSFLPLEKSGGDFFFTEGIGILDEC